MPRACSSSPDAPDSGDARRLDVINDALEVRRTLTSVLLDLGVLSKDLPFAAVQVVLDGRPLGFKAKPAFALLVAGYPQVRGEFTLSQRQLSFPSVVSPKRTIRGSRGAAGDR
jgi:hypothetical protein